jgi:hypothetical protein
MAAIFASHQATRRRPRDPGRDNSVTIARVTMAATSSVSAPIGFAPVESVVDDQERPGVLRSIRRRPSDDHASVAFATCTIRNLDTADRAPGFAEAGFEAVRLPERSGLVPLLGEISDAGAASDDHVERLRALLTGSAIELADGSRLHIDHVADDGVIVRHAGPDGTQIDGAAHQGAVNVHIDQDVLGTPLRQLFDGGAAEVFAHESPDSRNDTSSHHLVNLWLPLQQITRPLTLMDGRTLDRRRHQLRHHLVVDGFLDRDEDQAVNDIWACLHDPAQEWWFRPDAELGEAYVFDTLSTPHASFVSPGEDVAADRHRRLGAVIDAVGTGDHRRRRELAQAPPLDLHPDASEPLRVAVDAMDGLLAEVRAAAEGDLDDTWCARAQAARDAVVRRSLELRAVVTRVGH